ncbi:hypothetical protein HRI_003550100 [Hibiscus trionum]|uniref:Peptidase metallopeptidase domain-containing protein n=1 Tax=Hibiscus trionum TaxID=183268 RepID=A0A9W7MEL3_HIBTR|nr:hypothetical protein HRI_003550100 [Hibiscus trionum]
MAVKFSHQLYGVFLTFFVLQPFVVDSRPVELEPPHNHEQGLRRSNGSLDDIARSSRDGLFQSEVNYTLYGGKWNNSPVTYGFESTSPMPSGLHREKVTAVIDAAFRKWQNVVPEFAFQRVYPGDDADITISFTTLSLELYGYGYYPPDGMLYLDIDHTHWSTKSKLAWNKHDLLSGAMHEIGHTLGLKHSENQSAVMYPTLYPGNTRRELSQEDIDRIQSLYYDW